MTSDKFFLLMSFQFAKTLNATVQKNGVSLVLPDNRSRFVLIELLLISVVRIAASMAHTAKGIQVL